MKKIGWLFFVLASVLLSACGEKQQEMSQYVDVYFSGMDTYGTADYHVNEAKLFKDLLDQDLSEEIFDEKIVEEMNDIFASYAITLDKTENLSNGEKVTMTIKINPEKSKKLKSGSKTIEVSGLEEPKLVTTEEVQSSLIVNFIGASGQGSVQIDRVFDEPILNEIPFLVENDGQLTNGSQAKITLDKAGELELKSNGYLLDDNFSPTFEVTGLSEVAQKATDIANLKDIERMIDEETKRQYSDYDPNESWGRYYEIVQEKRMYRQFLSGKELTDTWFYGHDGGDANGNLIGIFTVKKYTGGTETKLVDQVTAIIGYSNIILDADKKANVAEINKIYTEKDDTYSLESVIQLYEGYGYEVVN